MEGRPPGLAAPGKNPVSHTGKLYGLAAQYRAADLVEQVAPILEAQCLLLSRIGMPVDAPFLAEVSLCSAEGHEPEDFRVDVERILSRRLEPLADVWRDLETQRAGA